MELKIINKRLWPVIAIAAAVIGYLFWSYCLAPLSRDFIAVPKTERERGPQEASKKNAFVEGSVYLYSKAWGAKFCGGQEVKLPGRISANKAIRMKLFIRQDNRREVGVKYISVAFSKNTEIYSGEFEKKKWMDSGRQDANEYIYVVAKLVPHGIDVELPYLDVSFKTPGLYDMKYYVAIEGEKAVSDGCVLKVY